MHHLIFRKQVQSPYIPFMTKLYKIYAVSLNKIVNNLLSAEYERFAGAKRLLDIMDHLIFKWGKELSSKDGSSKALEGYFQQVLLWIINKALYFKRGGRSANAIGVLEETKDLYRAMKNSKCAETLNICGRFSLVLGVLYLEVQLPHNALDILIESIKCWSIEQRMRLKEFNRIVIHCFSSRVVYKIRRCLMFISIGIYSIGFAYELLSQHIEALESYRMCKWYCNAQRQIFGDNSPLNTLNFLTKSSAEEENKILATLDRKIELEKAEAPKKVDDNDVERIINSIWPRTTDSGEIDERIKASQFNSILNKIKGKDKQTNTRAVNIQDSTKRSTDEFIIRTTLPKSPQASRFSIRAESQRKRQNSKGEQKMLDPDNFFKRKICSDLQIDTDWLDEKDPRKRFRQDVIESIIKRENYSHKSVNILKKFLMTKSKDKKIKEPRENGPNALRSTAYYKLEHKIHVLKTDIAIQNYAQLSKTPTIAFYSSGRRATVLGSPTSLCKEQSKGPVKEQEQKKVITKLVEKLRKDINNLERNIHQSKKKKKLNLNKKKQDNLDKEMKKYQSLANSIIHERIGVSQKRAIKRLSSIGYKFAK